MRSPTFGVGRESRRVLRLCELEFYCYLADLSFFARANRSVSCRHRETAVVSLEPLFCRGNFPQLTGDEIVLCTTQLSLVLGNL